MSASGLEARTLRSRLALTGRAGSGRLMTVRFEEAEW